MLLFVLTTTVLAQRIDFETPALLDSDPPGIFSGVSVPTLRQPQTLRVEFDGGAHRGNGRLVIRDGHRGPGYDTQSLVTLVNNDQGSLHARFWVRVSPDGGNGTASLISLIAGGSTRSEAILLQEGEALSVRGDCIGADGGSVSSPSYVMDGGWHLLEVSSLRVGTANGACEFTFDGEQTRVDRNFDGLRYDVIVLGLAYAASELAGVYEFDDFGLAPEPFPSRLVLEIPDGGRVGDCQDARVSIANSRGDSEVVDGGVALRLRGAAFSGPGCVGDAPVVISDATAFGFMAQVPGDVVVRAESDDLLADQRVFVATARVRGDYGIGCGCSSGDAVLIMLALISARRIRRA